MTATKGSIHDLSSLNKLAVLGGMPEVSVQPSLPSRWLGRELDYLSEMVEQKSLFYWNGPQTKRLLQKFREHYPLPHLMPCSSGTAAVHIAMASAGLRPGDEVIVPPITDMGSLIGILYQQAVPVFADVDPDAFNLDPEDVEQKITSRTKAILAVHLGGNPCDIQALRQIADERGIILIEDCAQAWGAMVGDKPVGTFGDLSCFSFNDYKHLSCGDGGVVGSINPAFGDRLQGFGDKGYDRVSGRRDTAILAPNYRISEPQSAVAAAQLERMAAITARFNEIGESFSRAVEVIPGLAPMRVRKGNRATYFSFLFRLKPDSFSCDRADFISALCAEGVKAAPGPIAMPLYQYPVFKNHAFFGGEWPIKQFGLTSMDYGKVQCKVAEEVLGSCISLAIHEGLCDRYVVGVSRALEKIAKHFSTNRSTNRLREAAAV